MRKHKILEPKKRHGGLSQADFYQMYAYGSAGEWNYEDTILLYPMSGVAQRTFRQGEMRLHVRQFDPRGIFDGDSGSPNERKIADKLSLALSIV